MSAADIAYELATGAARSAASNVVICGDPPVRALVLAVASTGAGLAAAGPSLWVLGPGIASTLVAVGVASPLVLGLTLAIAPVTGSLLVGGTVSFVGRKLWRWREQ